MYPSYRNCKFVPFSTLFIIQFLTASLAVQGIAFRQEQVVEFAQILEHFVMYSSPIILYQFETSLDMFVELYQIISEYLRQFSHVGI